MKMAIKRLVNEFYNLDDFTENYAVSPGYAT